MSKSNIKNLTVAAMFTAIIVVCAQIVVPIPPIEFTMQVFGVLLAGAMLSPFYATLAVTTYVLLGAFGMPVFKHFTGGFQSVVGPTGGYIIAFIFMALATSLAVKYLPNLLNRIFGNSREHHTEYRIEHRMKHISLAIGLAVSIVICHLFGTTWFALSMDKSFKESFLLCSAPFILPDIAKAVCAGLVSVVIKKRITL
jgi:biotin transport system substrate-specific component